MSKFGTKEEILSSIQSLFENLQSGSLTADEMESLVELTRELNERALILRYKSYEEKVFGVRMTTPETENEDGNQTSETESIAENIPEESNELIEPIVVAPIIEVQHSMGFEEIETEMLAAEALPEDEPVFDFDMFEKAESATLENEFTSNEPIELENEPMNLENKTSVENQYIEANELNDDQSDDIIQEENETLQIEESIVVQHNEIPETEAIQIANEIEESPVTVSEQMPFQTYQVTETIQSKERESEIPLPEELAMMNEPVIIPEKAPEVQPTSENDMFRRFTGGNGDDSLSSRLSASKLQTLNGAFGLNEKLQCIRELFKGSSEAFNQAIETLDKQDNFSDAKRILAQYAQQNSWNLESNLTSEFIQKIERRFL